MNFLFNIFWNSTENRLRTGWRLIIQLLLAIVLLALLGFIAGVVLALIPPGSAPTLFFETVWGPPLIDLLGVSATGLVLFTSIILAVRFLDRRPLVDLGFAICPQWWSDLALGFGLGALLIALVFSVELSLGWITI